MPIELFTKNLKYLRRKAEISQDELAKELGVCRQTVTAWETRGAWPGIVLLILICDYFNVTADELMRADMSEKTEPESTKIFSN
jgi:transcriptional regulator with XRE-family HTH domain